MSTANLDSADLKGVDHNGLIHEDVMSRIWDISNIPLPLTDRIDSDDADNAYKEWTTDKLQDPDTENARVDGSDTVDNNDTNPPADPGTVGYNAEPARQGNHCQISTKTVKVSTRSRNSDTIGQSDSLGYQVMMRQRELRRDVEAIMLTNQASLADDGDTVAGLSAGLGAWLTINSDKPADGVFGGFANGIVAAYTPGTARALTETIVRDVAENVYNEGGDPSMFMSVPTVIRKFSSYLFTSSARIATLQSDTGQAKESVTAKGSVNVFVTDFDVVLDLVPNRIQQVVSAGVANAYILTPEYLALAMLHGYRTEPLAKTGLADKRQMAVDWTLVVNTQRAHGAILDIDITADVTQ